MNVITVTEGADRFTANAYLLSGEVPTLVDVGTWPPALDKVTEHVDTLEALVVTHSHHDHIELLPEAIDRFDPTVYAFGGDLDDAIRVEDGDTIPMGDHTFEVIHTPGHADDHISLVSETALFSGDVVVYNDGAFDDGSFGRTDLPGQSREVLIRSIERLLERLPESVQTMYPGHGSVYSSDVHAVIERALDRAKLHEPKYPEEA